MSDKNVKTPIDRPVHEPEIFGRSKSRDEIREEQKAERIAQRAAAKEERRALREQKSTEPKEKHPEMWVMAGVLALVIIGCIVALTVQLHKEAREMEFARDESRLSYFVDDTAVPELSDEGLTAAVNEVYYTNGGYLCVRMTLGNGLDVDQHMQSLEVEISNGNTEELIGSGYTANISEKYIVPANGTNQYTFYISPEYVKITDDALSRISYSITVTGYNAE